MSKNKADPYDELRCSKCKALGDKAPEPDTCDDCIKVHRDYASAMGLPDPVTPLTVHCTYYGGTLSNITLPLHKTWADVEDCYIKWNTLHIKFKGEDSYGEYELNFHLESDDMKRPVSYSILSEDGDIMKDG